MILLWLNMRVLTLLCLRLHLLPTLTHLLTHAHTRTHTPTHHRLLCCPTQAYAPGAHARRVRQSGIYTSRLIRDTGDGGKPVGVILLDLRWNKGHPDDPAKLLGTEQWRWLATTLKAHADAGAGLTVVVSSLTVLPEPRAPFESWDLKPFRAERKRLIRLLAAAGHPVVLASGDVHLGEMSLAHCSTKRDANSKTTGVDESGSDGGSVSSLSSDARAGGFTVLELTSSGMTHTHGDRWWSWIIFGFLHGAVPFPYAVGYTLQHNFGEFEIDWRAETITATLYGDGGVMLLTRTVALADLRGDAVGGDGTEPVVCHGSTPEWLVWAFFAVIAAIVFAAFATVAAVVGASARGCLGRLFLMSLGTREKHD